MPIAFATVVPIDWKEIGALLGVILTVALMVRLLFSAAAERAILWLIRSKVSVWDETAAFSAAGRERAAKYEARALGWDAAASQSKANMDRITDMQTKLEAHAHQMIDLDKTVTRCESNYEMLGEIKKEILAIHQTTRETDQKVASIEGIMIGEARRNGQADRRNPPPRRIEDV